MLPSSWLYEFCSYWISWMPWPWILTLTYFYIVCDTQLNLISFVQLHFVQCHNLIIGNELNTKKFMLTNLCIWRYKFLPFCYNVICRYWIKYVDVIKHIPVFTLISFNFQHQYFANTYINCNCGITIKDYTGLIKCLGYALYRICSV